VIHLLNKLQSALKHDCVFVGGVVDWFYFARPLRDIDVCSRNGRNMHGAQVMGGRHFGSKWRFRFQGWSVECFDHQLQPAWRDIAGLKIQTPASRLAVIERILNLPESDWINTKRLRLEPMVSKYRELEATA
jgi:hypothetical protein